MKIGAPTVLSFTPRRGNALPIYVNWSGDFSVGSAGTGICAASAANSPILIAGFGVFGEQSGGCHALTGLTVGAAAYAVDYASASQFSREFKRLLGNPPSAEVQMDIAMNMS